jgi:hypothetical protein
MTVLYFIYFYQPGVHTDPRWATSDSPIGGRIRVKGLRRLEIPPKTTPKIQRLDIFFNRQCKVIAHRVYDCVILDDIDIHLAERKNIIRLHSLIHNQLSAPIFIPMIQYAWFKSGYTDVHPGQFHSVVNICFKFPQSHCDIAGCDSFSFIRCSYCSKIMCFDHSFINFHTHWCSELHESTFEYMTFYFIIIPFYMRKMNILDKKQTFYLLLWTKKGA